MPTWLAAGLWGLLAGSALVLGALIGLFADVPRRLVAAVMAFGAGVLMSALSFELMDEAYRQGGGLATGLGFLAGAAVYTGTNWLLSQGGARHRKRSERNPREADQPGSGTAIAIGALLDGIPESAVIGVSLLRGGAVGGVAVIAIFLSNLPEGLASAAGMRKAGRSRRYVLGLWMAIAVTSGVAALLGNLVLAQFGPAVIAATTAVAAGAILSMITDTMVPEAFEEAGHLAGLLAVLGFLAAFALSKMA